MSNIVMLKYGIEKKTKCKRFFFRFSFKWILLFINITIDIFLLLDQQQDIPLFFILLNERKSNIYKTIDGTPILHLLVSTSEQPDLIKTIINLGADVNTEDNSGFSALYVLSSNYTLGKLNVQFVLQFINIFSDYEKITKTICIVLKFCFSFIKT